jgi:hypothetical protein
LQLLAARDVQLGPDVGLSSSIWRGAYVAEQELGLPTNFKNFLLDQPKNSAAGKKVRPPQNTDSQWPILPFFQRFMIQNV